MNKIKGFILISILFLSQICLAQVSDELMLYRKNIQNISANNTVTVTSYEKDGSHYVYAGGFGNIDVYSLDTKPNQ